MIWKINNGSNDHYLKIKLGTDVHIAQKKRNLKHKVHKKNGKPYEKKNLQFTMYLRLWYIKKTIKKKKKNQLTWEMEIFFS